MAEIAGTQVMADLKIADGTPEAVGIPLPGGDLGIVEEARATMRGDEGNVTAGGTAPGTIGNSRLSSETYLASHTFFSADKSAHDSEELPSGKEDSDLGMYFFDNICSHPHRLLQRMEIITKKPLCSCIFPRAWKIPGH